MDAEAGARRVFAVAAAAGSLACRDALAHVRFVTHGDSSRNRKQFREVALGADDFPLLPKRNSLRHWHEHFFCAFEIAFPHGHDLAFPIK